MSTQPGPVMVASGCGGTGRELEPYVDSATYRAQRIFYPLTASPAR